jgi:glycine dehydrogenase subunit 2
VPFLRKGAHGLELVEHAEENALDRITAFHGQMGMYVRALTYMLSHGGDGLAQAAEDAVLNANYIKARLEHVFSVPYNDYPTMHEALFDDSFLAGTGVTTLDFAKALIDEGFHPMTMYFPLVVRGAMLVEPTESESKQTLDQFCAVMEALAADAGAGNTDRFTAAPLKAPRRRLDETRAARQPILKWERPEDLPQAAE